MIRLDTSTRRGTSTRVGSGAPALGALALSMAACAAPSAETKAACLDTLGPVIHHTPVDEPVPVGQDVLIQASARDPCGVFSMDLHARPEADVSWVVVGMTHVGDTVDGDSIYQGVIPGRFVTGAAILYYLEAWDDTAAQNPRCAPEGCDADAWRVPVGP